MTKTRVDDNARGNLARLTDAGIRTPARGLPDAPGKRAAPVVDHFASPDLPELTAAFEAMRDSLKE